MTQLSAPSGSGKTTVLLGVLFALTGGRVIPTDKKKSIVRLFLGPDVCIIRTKRPDTLELRYYEACFKDEEAEGILRHWLSEDWSTVSFVFQHQLCAFFNFTGEQKLSFVERALFDGKEASMLRDQVRKKILELANTEEANWKMLSSLTDEELKILPFVKDYDSMNRELDSLIAEEASLMNLWKECSERSSLCTLWNQCKEDIDKYSTELRKEEESIRSIRELVEKRKFRDRLGHANSLLLEEASDEGWQNLVLHWKEFKQVEEFRKKYGYVPSAHKLEELDELLYLDNCCKANCPRCEQPLLVFVNWRDRKLDKVEVDLDERKNVAPAKKKEERQQMELLLNHRSTKPQWTVEEYEKALQIRKLGELATEEQVEKFENHEKKRSLMNALIKQEEELREKLNFMNQNLPEMEAIEKRIQAVREQMDHLRNISRISSFRPFYYSWMDTTRVKVLWLEIKEVFETVREHFVNSRLDFLNAELNSLLSLLFSGGMTGHFVYAKNFSLELEWKGMTFSNGKGLSGGEMERVSLAVMLAFHAALRPSLHFLLFDESFSSLDGDSLRTTVEVLRSCFASHIVWSTHHPDCLSDEILKI
ncbi:uncharacterized protein Gasu_21280 [Galdieria sulphuraria]|uniref:RecF/RecN/SMC N-terminal domain-containing protein n=1 Tax=Galdieria sulphuraria TaxID=130081 RepID=M2W4J5_GALSU|nr:uncharacterized protein Gasu_21280 [Galdieria sulphuraria]EME30671.1 hypothetical protein Gasu_21280 [Galdieria sulphuraria]|eukprot:XP_005707191.1 hypothetical protein Gasu_21280 [Galdieria sulphuraria]